MQALYQHILTQDTAAKIEAEFRVDYGMSAVDLARGLLGRFDGSLARLIGASP